MVVSVPATSANLGPGFDALGLALGLRNEVTIKPSKFLSLATYGEGKDNPRIRKNGLFLSIFNEHFLRLNGKERHFRFEFQNRIPISRGMGSSSAVIVLALTAAYTAAGVTYKKREILNLALRYESHPDNITPAVMGGFNTACVENEKVYSKKIQMPSYLKAVMVIPSMPMSTNRSRHALPNCFKKAEVSYSLSHAAYLVSLIMSESWDLLKIASRDRLHQIRRMKILPTLFEVQKVALRYGALMSTLSGSGSSFFNLVYEKDAPLLEKKLKESFKEFRVVTLSLDNQGVIVY